MDSFPGILLFTIEKTQYGSSLLKLKRTFKMAEKKKFLLRIDEKVYAALEKWAADELRSINAQIEFLLTEALKKSGRFPQKPEENNPIETNNPNP